MTVMQYLRSSFLLVLRSYHVVHHKPESYGQSQACLTTGDGTQPKSEGTQATVHGMADIPCTEPVQLLLRFCIGVPWIEHSAFMRTSALVVLSCHAQCVSSSMQNLRKKPLVTSLLPARADVNG